MFGRSYFIECDDRVIEVIDYDDEDNSKAVLSLAKEIGEKNNCLNYGIDFMKIHCTYKWRHEFLSRLPLCYRVKEYVFESSMLRHLLASGKPYWGDNVSEYIYCKEIERS